MSNCIKCELTRAKLIAHMQRALRWSTYDTAAFLSEQNGVEYYVLPDGTLMRKSQLPPFNDYVVMKVKENAKENTG